MMSRSAVEAPIPSYEEAVVAPPPTSSAPAVQPTTATTYTLPVAPPPTVSPSRSLPDPVVDVPPELPPAYAVVDEKATTFTIYGTFLHTPSGPAYQLSSLLDARIAKLRIRRLRAEEVTRLQSGASTVPFDNRSVLYEAHDPPFLVNEFYISSKSSHGLPGTLQLKFGLRRWHVKHIPVQGGRMNEIMTCGKPGGWKKAVKERRNEMEPSEWKDSEGTVVATEVLRMQGGGKMPTIELREDLNNTCRELILALWVARLWAAFGAGGGGI